MVLHLAERLDIPLRDRNVLLVSAGFAPMFPERQLEDPQLRSARRAIELVLIGPRSPIQPSPWIATGSWWRPTAAA